MRNYQSSSSKKTKKFAAAFARKVIKRQPGRHALVIGLSGDLGAGKTTFIQGFLRAFGVKKKITSPTFVLMHRHALRHKNLKQAHHIDSYRLKNHRDAEILDLKKLIADPENIVLIEWAEKIKKLLPKDTTWLKLSHGKKETERRISFSRVKKAGDTPIVVSKGRKYN